MDTALRRASPGTGSDLKFLRTRTWSEPAVGIDLHRITTPYVIVGGVAAALSMPRRVTLDLDILVQSAGESRLEATFVSAGARRIGPLAIGGSRWRTADGSDLAVLVSDEAWVAEAVAHPNRSPDGLPVIALPFLVLMKLAASRAQDLADLGRVLGQADESTRRHVRQVTASYRPEDRPDVASLIALGDIELIEDRPPSDT